MSDDPPDADILKRIAELIDGDGWQLGDLLAEHFDADTYGDGARANSGLYGELRRYEIALARDFGLVGAGSTLRIARSTALAWPHDTRVSSVPFTVHKLVRGADRLDRMARYVKRAEREGSTLSKRMVARYRAEDSPTSPRPFDDRMRRAITNGVRRELLGGIVTSRDDWWMVAQVSAEARDVAVRELRRLASAIAKGDGDA